MNPHRFELRTPSNQTIADIFLDSWATDLDKVCGVTNTGKVGLFEDGRIGLAASALGASGRFDNFSILELGPLEGAHSYQLEQLGAKSVVAVEANTEAFLKCLLVKEMLQLRTRYLCGDVISYLVNCEENFDMVFCCGILYHMQDPLELIKQICLHTDRCFVWTHYHDSTALERAGARLALPVEKNGFRTTYYQQDYSTMDGNLFLGGNRSQNSWLEQAEITRAFAHFGLPIATMLGDEKNHPNGASFSCAYARAA